MLSAALVGAALTAPALVGAPLVGAVLVGAELTASATGCAAATRIGASATITVINAATAVTAARSVRACPLAIAPILAHLARLRATVRRVTHPARMSLVTLCLLLACGDPPARSGTAGTTTTVSTASTASSTNPSSSTSTTLEPTPTATTDPTTTAPTTNPETTTTSSSSSSSETTSSEATTGLPAAPIPLRALFINVGNASPQYGCWEYKLCRPQDVVSVREYIATWQPDVIALSEVLRAEQLTGDIAGGPILPDGYTGVCGDSRDRSSGELAAWDADNASHQHECVAWKTSRLAAIAGGTASVYGAESCEYDFTGFRARLLLDGAHELGVVAVHPNSTNVACRTQEIARYWSELATGSRVLIGGDWNSDSDDELQRAPDFDIAYLRGQHWNIVFHDDEYSAEYSFGLKKEKYDHVFVNFGGPLTTSLAFGSALGGHDDHPRADNGGGFDHRQLLVDLEFEPADP